MTYQFALTNGEAYDRWKGCTDGPARLAPPTPEMRSLMDVVAEAIDSGLFYTKDVLKFVVERVKPTAEELARGKGVEGGVVGMEAYYARHALEAERAKAADEAALARLALAVGAKLGTLKFQGKAWRTCVVAAIRGTSFDIEATRGNRRYRINGVRAVTLEHQMTARPLDCNGRAANKGLSVSA